MNPQQAVILCGGLGTRLRPLTDTMPKPMVPVNGKPFLQHLIAQISAQGIRRVLLLTGYRGEMIRAYFGGGQALGVEIDYSHGPEDWDTGRRVWEARSHLESQFLLLYSDNFAQFRLQRLLSLYHKHHRPITLVLAPKEKGNIKVSSDGKIEAYNKTRKGDGFDYVELGYMLVDRDVMLHKLSTCTGFPNTSFSNLLQKFANESNIAADIVRDPYHSISDIDRLQLMREYLRPKKILLIDRDGVINQKAPKGEYISTWKEFQWISETRQAMKLLAQDGFQFIIITNQAGIARNMVDPVELKNIHQNMVDALSSDGIDILRVYMSPHHWDEGSFMRKPSPGMFFQAAKEWSLRMDRSLYIGDDVRDCQAAFNAGCGMIYLTNESPSSDPVNYPTPYFVTKTLGDSIKQIKETYLEWEKIG